MSQNSVVRHRRWFLKLAIVTVALAISIGSVLMYALTLSTAAAVQSSIDSYAPYLSGLRLLIIALIAYAWPRLIRYAQHSGRISTDVETQLQSLRWRMVSWLLIIELLLGHNLVGRLLSPMGGAGL